MAWLNLREEIAEEFTHEPQISAFGYEMQARKREHDRVKSAEWHAKNKDDPAFRLYKSQSSKDYREKMKGDPLYLFKKRIRDKRRHEKRKANPEVHAAYLQKLRDYRAKRPKPVRKKPPTMTEQIEALKAEIAALKAERDNLAVQLRHAILEIQSVKSQLLNRSRRK